LERQGEDTKRNEGSCVERKKKFLIKRIRKLFDWQMSEDEESMEVE